VSHLPASWGTLYELSRVPDPDLEQAINDGIVRPDMARSEAQKLLPPPSPRAPRKDPEPAPPRDDPPRRRDPEPEPEPEPPLDGGALTIAPTSSGVSSRAPDILSESIAERIHKDQWLSR
jgi:hypothetical protein